MTGQISGAAGKIDPRDPLFFLSYAHEAQREHDVPRGRNRWFAKFFNDLSENVAELISREPGSDPGYMDMSIPYGDHWNANLLHAVGTCQVFVALLSRPYFRSEWCGMEWYAFSQRKVTGRGSAGSSNQTAIVPVIWAPFRDEDVPSAVSPVQRFSPRGLPDEVRAQYEADGVFGLLKMSVDHAYPMVIWRLARHIADIHYAHRVEPNVLLDTELCDSFRGGDCE